MSDDINLPRVIIHKREGYASLEFNFTPEKEREVGDSSIVERLLGLADDWTSFCVSHIKFTPSISQAGYFWLDHAVNEDILTFLNDVSISKEISRNPDSDIDDLTYSFILHEDDLQQVANKLATTTRIIRAADAVKRSALGSLVAEFDYFMLRFLEICSEKLPDKFYDESKSISIRDFKSIGGLDEVIRRQVQDTINQRLRESHSETISWVVSKLELSKDVTKHKEDGVFKDFVEVCQRRHILTHNGGIVNSTYLAKCSEAGLDLNKLPKLGERADVTKQYLMRATARVYLTGFFLVHLFIQNVMKGYQRKSFGNLLSTSHTFLEEDLTKLALRVVDFAEISKKQFDHDMHLKFGINRALASLFDPAMEPDEQVAAAEVALSRYDWSVKDPIFTLALACTRRDFSGLIPLARQAHEAGLDYNSARTFAVFREARRLEGFLDCFPRSPLMLTSPNTKV